MPAWRLIQFIALGQCPAKPGVTRERAVVVIPKFTKYVFPVVPVFAQIESTLLRFHAEKTILEDSAKTAYCFHGIKDPLRKGQPLYKGHHSYPQEFTCKYTFKPPREDNLSKRNKMAVLLVWWGWQQKYCIYKIVWVIGTATQLCAATEKRSMVPQDLVVVFSQTNRTSSYGAWMYWY